MGTRPNGTCVAWWYLDCGAGNAHCFIAVFVHDKRDEFLVEIAEGKASFDSFVKDDHITKPGWCFTSNTRRATLGRVLKYANAIAEERKGRGFKQSFFSYNEYTGTGTDVVMQQWEDVHNDMRHVSLTQTPRPRWFPTKGNLYWTKPNNARRDELHGEGFDIIELINCARDKHKRRKRKINGRVTRRVGRFTVYAKDNQNA